MPGIWLAAFLLAAEPPRIEPYVDEACATSFSCQDRLIWELIYQGVVISEPNEDLTESECEDLRSELEPQTEPFTTLECRPRLVERQDL